MAPRDVVGDEQDWCVPCLRAEVTQLREALVDVERIASVWRNERDGARAAFSAVSDAVIYAAGDAFAVEVDGGMDAAAENLVRCISRLVKERDEAQREVHLLQSEAGNARAERDEARAAVTHLEKIIDLLERKVDGPAGLRARAEKAEATLRDIAERQREEDALAAERSAAVAGQPRAAWGRVIRATPLVTDGGES
jgi:hypothetical protein